MARGAESTNGVDVRPEVAGPEREWHRALALVLFVVATAVVNPFVLLGLPFVVMAVGFRVRRSWALAVAALVAVGILGRPLDGGLWYVERGWMLLASGWFVALTLAWPAARLSNRALGSVLGAAGVAVGLFALRPGMWSVVDWRIRDRLMGGVAQALAILAEVQGEEGLPEGLADSVYQTAEIQAQLFPASLALGTMAGLAVAWWLFSRLAEGRRGALGSVREFRFDDQWVWLFLVGVAAVVVGTSGTWERAGSNAVVFMGGLYVLRGAAVLLFLSGGVSVLGAIFLAVAMLLVAPLVLGAALVVGLGDTWLDVRTRVRALAG